jgi:hypothetical protein
MYKKMVLLSSVILVVAFCSLSFTEEPLYKNLKVLKKNTTHDELELVMKEFKTALGVKCGFCHTESKVNPGKLDFVSDENEHKNIARDMMRMTTRINKKFFGQNKEGNEGGISCFTCHRGDKEPKEAPKEVLDN